MAEKEWDEMSPQEKADSSIKSDMEWPLGSFHDTREALLKDRLQYAYAEKYRSQENMDSITENALEILDKANYLGSDAADRVRKWLRDRDDFSEYWMFHDMGYRPVACDYQDDEDDEYRCPSLCIVPPKREYREEDGKMVCTTTPPSDDDVSKMLESVGWTPIHYSQGHGDPYDYSTCLAHRKVQEETQITRYVVCLNHSDQVLDLQSGELAPENADKATWMGRINQMQGIEFYWCPKCTNHAKEYGVSDPNLLRGMKEGGWAYRLDNHRTPTYFFPEAMLVPNLSWDEREARIKELGKPEYPAPLPDEVRERILY